MSQIITTKFLKQHHTCQEGIIFFENNFPTTLFPNGLNFSQIEVTGDYNYYFQWINKLSECTFEYDNFGNIIKKIYSEGYIYEYHYDSKGNLIKTISPNGTIIEYKY